jgi:hypothetical protein
MSSVSKLQGENVDDIREHYHEGGAIALLLPRKEGLYVLDRHKSLET